MSEWKEVLKYMHRNTIKVEIETGIAWAGFWIGLGIVLAAEIIVTGEAIL